jgi:hypothetical protein
VWAEFTQLRWSAFVNPIMNVLLSQEEGNVLVKTPWPLVRKRTIRTERPPHVGEVSANFGGYRVSRGQRNESPRSLIRLP